MARNHPYGRSRGERLIGRLATLAVIMALVHLLNWFPLEGGTTLRLGFLLVGSYLAGLVAADLALPKITGFLVLGVLAGPDVFGLLSTGDVEQLRLINEIALSLIALAAGGELRLEAVRERLRSIWTITAVQVIVVFAIVTVVVFGAHFTIGFLAEQPNRSVWAAALLLGMVAVAKSPATTIAVITEEKARGVLTDTVLGITIIKDVVILIFIAVLIPLSVTIADPGTRFDIHAVEEVLVVIAVSLAVGMVFGLAMTEALRRVEGHDVILVLGAAFLAAELGELFHLEYILIAMVAGFVVQNWSEQGADLLEGLDRNSTPVYALFFAVAGAGLDLGALGHVWRFAVLFIVARTAAIFGSTWLGGSVAGDSSGVRNLAWTGFMAQAGVTLGLANMIEVRFAVMGHEIAVIIIAMIAVNQFVGPPLFRWALVRSGESRTALERAARRG
ncbi:MAG: cation:proton antiporter [Candidatus Longimicrobiales bacterium M2_2A_002]